MAGSQKGKDLSCEEVAPPSQLFCRTSRVEVEDVLSSVDVQTLNQHEACIVLDVGRGSPVGNPFATDWARPDVSLRAYDDLLSMTVWLGAQGCVARAEGLPALIALRHDVQLSARAPPFDVAKAWHYLRGLAAVDAPLRVIGF